jgi:hypothetical protein
MRDPGPPRRNPFFEHGSEGATDDPGMGWRDPADDEPAPPRGPSGTVGVGGFAALLALVEGLGDAQPEAAEHLAAAAHEVVLTVKVLVDATEAVLAEQRDAMAARHEARHEPRSADASSDRERSAHGDVTDLAVRRAEGP